ncbi:MAG: hypothetical protein HAW62_05475 [Endozoicomonadaceae bacterium]|nr:hypothetical protein [Endozoicomonadaceae bacterium]
MKFRIKYVLFFISIHGFTVHGLAAERYIFFGASNVDTGNCPSPSNIINPSKYNMTMYISASNPVSPEMTGLNSRL